MLSTKELQDAARIIEERSFEGMNAATKIVGRNVALGMLVMILRKNHSNSGGLQRESSITKQINKELVNKGLVDVFHYSPILGKGVVYHEGKPTFVLEVEKMYKPRSAKGVHLGMLLGGPDDFRYLPAGVYPFRDVFDLMLKDRRKVLAALRRELTQLRKDVRKTKAV